jgi:hypothetical protein
MVFNVWRFFGVIKEINRLLEEKEKRLKQPSKDG